MRASGSFDASCAEVAARVSISVATLIRRWVGQSRTSGTVVPALRGGG
jgi:transposase